MNDFYVRKRGQQPAQDRNLLAGRLRITGPLARTPSNFRDRIGESSLHARRRNRLRRRPPNRSSATWPNATFRRPVAAEKSSAIAPGRDWRTRRAIVSRAGIQLALQALLVSPHFLFRVELDPEVAAVRDLNDFEFATRLSYFLWSSMPDESCFDWPRQGVPQRKQSGATGTPHAARTRSPPPLSRALRDNGSSSAAWPIWHSTQSIPRM